MIWNRYGECRGKAPTCEVVIRCDAADRDHPWVVQRKAMYEQMGRRVLVSHWPKKRSGRSRSGRSEEAAS